MWGFDVKMFLLCLALLLLTVFAFVHLLYTAHVDALKLWWLKNYRDYPSRRGRCGHLSRLVQDLLFKLDCAQYKLNYTKKVKERIQIKRALGCVISDPELVSVLSAPPDETITWDMHTSGQGTINYAAASGKVLNLTNTFRKLWASESVEDKLYIPCGECISESQVLLLMIDYCGHANIKDGIASMPYTTVYTGSVHTTLQFPPHHPSEAAVRGLTTRRVACATMDKLNITEQMQALCGPQADFYAGSNPLTYPELWFALWARGDISDLNPIVIEDTHLDLHTI
jgi:hypothetical protein